MSRYSEIAQTLIRWYEKNARDLPWRDTKDPYTIWVSEIILQQTTVNQGLPYFKKFIRKYPDVQALASAHEDELLKVWEGLGYYNRARNMHGSAKEIVSSHEGEFPNSYEDIIRLKGVGPYTAAAISSFAFGQPYPVVDGNVSRLISRLFGIADPVDKGPVIKKIYGIADKLITHASPEIFNQAVMEFGALQCVPKNPDCESCPLKRQCISYRQGWVKEIPVKSKKVKKRTRYFSYYHIVDSEGLIIIEKRSGNDIWKGLFQFPLLEDSKQSFQNPPVVNFVRKQDVGEMRSSDPYTQTLSHQKIYARFIYITITKKHNLFPRENIQLVGHAELKNYPFPKIIDLYLSDKSITLF